MKVKTSVSLDQKLLAEVKKRAKEENRSVSNYLEKEIQKILIRGKSK